MKGKICYALKSSVDQAVQTLDGQSLDDFDKIVLKLYSANSARTQPGSSASIPPNKVIIRPIKEGVYDDQVFDLLKNYNGLSSVAIEDCKEEQLKGSRLVEVMFSNRDSLLQLVKDIESDEKHSINQFIVEGSKPEVIYSSQLINQAQNPGQGQSQSSGGYRGGRTHRGGRRGNYGGRGGYRQGKGGFGQDADQQVMLQQYQMMMMMMQQN